MHCRGGLRSGWIFLLSHWFPQDRPLREMRRHLGSAAKSGLTAYWETYEFPGHCRVVAEPERRLECER
jgi:hypothetical protein